MNTSTTISINCPYCDHQFRADVTPPTPASGFSGPPENYDPGDGGEVVPDCCPACGVELDLGPIFEQAAEQFRDQREAAAKARYDARREDQMLNRE